MFFKLHMYFVYLLKSKIDPEKMYVGYTPDLKRRIEEHNSGKSRYTTNHKPWNIHSFFAFEVKEKAVSFEKYLKSHAGRAFISKRFW